MKKKYKILSLLKKIKKSNLSLNLNSLNSEKKKLERINVELKDLLNNSNFKAGEILNSSQLKNTSSFRNNIQEKIDQTIKQGGKIITGGERPKELKDAMEHLLTNTDLRKKMRDTFLSLI